MAKKIRLPLGEFLKRFCTETRCQEYLASVRWPTGYVCPRCGCRQGHRLSNGRYQCVHCRYQTSVMAGTVLHKTHISLRVWFLAFYLVCTDKRGLSAVQLSAQLGVTYKTAWYMLKRIRAAMGQRDKQHQLSGKVEFDDSYFGGPTAGKKRDRGTEKAKVLVGLSLDEHGNPQYLKMKVTENIRQASVKKFARSAIAQGSVIHSDGYRSYIPALKDYIHEHRCRLAPLASYHSQQCEGFSFSEPITACPKRPFNPIWMSIVFAFTVAPLAALYGSVLPWLLLPLLGRTKGISTKYIFKCLFYHP